MFKRLSKLFVMGTLVGCGAGKGSAPTGTVRGTQGIETKNVNELAEKVNFKCGSANNDCPCAELDYRAMRQANNSVP